MWFLCNGIVHQQHEQPRLIVCLVAFQRKRHTPLQTSELQAVLETNLEDSLRKIFVFGRQRRPAKTDGKKLKKTYFSDFFANFTVFYGIFAHFNEN